MTSVAAERVRKFRKIRKDAGLVELRIWVAKEDKEAALEAVQGFVKEGLWQSICHQMYGADWRKHPEKFRNIALATGHPKLRDENGR